MESDEASFNCGSPPKPLPALPAGSADYYYLKAMDYLGREDGVESSDGEAGCQCSQEEDGPYGFRPGVPIHEDGSSSGGSTECSSPTSGGGEMGRRRAASLGSNTTATDAATAAARHRKLSIGSIAYGHATGGTPKGGDVKVRRKLSDGHVHWADEFQKDLTRSHPRKSYNRHPSHCMSNMRPILKAKHSEDDCLDEEENETGEDDSGQC